VKNLFLPPKLFGIIILGSVVFTSALLVNNPAEVVMTSVFAEPKPELEPEPEPEDDARKERIRSGTVTDETTVKVLTWNIYMLPLHLFIIDQGPRADKIPDHVKGYDVVVFQEAFSDDQREHIIEKLTEEYPHVTRILGDDSFPGQDGGVIILSKWEIDKQLQRLYGDLCSGDDCFADKGVLYARLDVNGKPLHIFGTHLQAGNGDIRDKQLVVMKNFIDEMAIPFYQPVLIAGDMNVNLYGGAEPNLFPGSDTYNNMLHTLQALQPLPPSRDPNDFGFTKSPDNYYNDASSSRSYLDYVLYSRYHLEPDDSYNDVHIFKDGLRIVADPRYPDFYRDLSDHYAVEGSFTFSSSYWWTEPVITVPRQPIIKWTSSTAGAIVTFTATAVDDVDGPITPTCTPASGSFFPTGTTKVTCTATDSDGVTASAKFNVIVLFSDDGECKFLCGIL